MDSKASDSANSGRPSSALSPLPSANGVATSAPVTAWWQWTHGKSGSVSSSSDGASAIGSSPHASASEAAIQMNFEDANTSSPVPEWGMRWEKRTTRTGPLAREDASRGSPASSVLSKLSNSPKVGVATLSPLLISGSVAARSTGVVAAPVARKKLVQSSIRSSRDVAVRKRFSASSVPGLHDFVLPVSTKDGRSTVIAGLDREMHSEMKWTGGPGKRKVVKKDKKAGRASSLHHLRLAPSSSSRPMRDWLDGGRAGGLDGELSLSLDVHMLEEKPVRCSSPMSTASTVSSAASLTSQAHVDPVTTCARAILVDCYRERRQVESSGLRKRTLEGRSKADKNSMWSYPRDLTKSPEGYGLSCGSSSSDDELREVSRRGVSKSDMDSDSKSTPEHDRMRQTMLRSHGASSSPEVEFSPLFDEKGLSAEMRYQLPLALGTANEIDKECTICKTRYGIGDHICTLPCQHYFHASCVDRWLCSHTSCPLCRWDVTADADSAGFLQKHQLAECSPSDREVFQRKMRSSTHSAGFRPVEPEVDQLQYHLSTLRLQEESDELNDDQVQYLVCPTPQRPQRK